MAKPPKPPIVHYKLEDGTIIETQKTIYQCKQCNTIGTTDIPTTELVNFGHPIDRIATLYDRLLCQDCGTKGMVSRAH